MNTFEQNQIVVNTYIALTGSVLGTFIISAIAFGRGLEMESILNATLADELLLELLVQLSIGLEWLY